MPAPRMSAPFTRSEIPMKNQMEIEPPGFIWTSPEDNVQDNKSHADNHGPEPGPMKHRNVTLGGNLGDAVDKAFEFRHRLRLGEHTDDDRHEGGRKAGPQRTVHVFRHVSRIRRERDVTKRRWIDLHPGPHAHRGTGAREQAPETAGRRRARPQHAEKDSSEERGDEETEKCRHVIHDALEIHY